MKAMHSLRLLTMMQTSLWITHSLLENYSYLLNDSENAQLKNSVTSLAENTVKQLDDLTIILQSLDIRVANEVRQITDEITAALYVMKYEQLGHTETSTSEDSKNNPPPTSPDTSRKNILPFRLMKNDTRRSRGCPYDRE